MDSGSGLKNLILIGDRVLIKPRSDADRTPRGLYLPPGVKEKEAVQSGYVVNVGPGYVVGSDELDQDWIPKGDKAPYIPLQAQLGDSAVFLLSAAHEVVFREAKYFVVLHRAILIVERDEALFD